MDAERKLLKVKTKLNKLRNAYKEALPWIVNSFEHVAIEHFIEDIDEILEEIEKRQDNKEITDEDLENDNFDWDGDSLDDNYF